MQSIDSGIFGIDVSRWQGNIDWNRVKAAGVNIAIIKASGADDGFYEDSRFQTNYQGAVASAIKVGAYHFFTEYEDANAQAEYFSNLLSGKTWDVKPAIDVESGSGDPQLADKVIAFCERVKALTGLDCVIYCNTNYAKNAFDNRVAKYPLWIAHYGVDTPGDNPIWQQWAGFQYSSDEYIDGIVGNTVDKNRFTEEMFLENVAAHQQTFAAAPPPVQASSQINNTYVVQGGDNLSSIAERFGTSWQVLAEINHITNPDVIYDGQVLNITDCHQPQPQGQTYTVQSGDTLSDIACRFGTDYQTLANINGILDPNTIYPRQEIRIS